jgi:hypothetical protein
MVIVQACHTKMLWHVQKKKTAAGSTGLLIHERSYGMCAGICLFMAAKLKYKFMVARVQ